MLFKNLLLSILYIFVLRTNVSSLWYTVASTSNRSLKNIYLRDIENFGKCFIVETILYNKVLNQLSYICIFGIIIVSAILQTFKHTIIILFNVSPYNVLQRILAQFLGQFKIAVSLSKFNGRSLIIM